MEWFTVITLILLGIVLVVAEIIIVPGTTIVGFIGLGIIITGLVLSFTYFGSTVGWSTLGATAVVSGILFYLSLRTKLWERFSLKTSISSRVNEGELGQVHLGDEGKAISALRPMGKVEFNNKMFEVTTLGAYVDSGQKVRVIRVAYNQIVVEPIN